MNEACSYITMGKHISDAEHMIAFKLGTKTPVAKYQLGGPLSYYAIYFVGEMITRRRIGGVMDRVVWLAVGRGVAWEQFCDDWETTRMSFENDRKKNAM